MEKTRPNLKVNHPRCPYCHDDIVPGGDNRACHGCLTWHHEECWGYGGCVSCGGESVKSQATKDSTGIVCVQHTPEKVSPQAVKDLIDLWGRDEIPCTCPEEPKIGGNLAFNRLVSTVSRLTKSPAPTDDVPPGMALVGSTCHSCHRTYTRTAGMTDCGCVAEKQKKCDHRWDPDSYQCFRCDADMEDIYGKAYVDSYIEKQVDDEILDEAIVCMSHRCEEPTSRREGGICSLCLAEAEIWGESRPEYSTADVRWHAINEYRRLTDVRLPDTPPLWLLAVLFISAVIFAAYMVWFRA